MTLLHINFPPDAGPLFFFLLEPFPTLSPFFSKGNRIVTARQFSTIHTRMENWRNWRIVRARSPVCTYTRGDSS